MAQKFVLRNHLTYPPRNHHGLITRATTLHAKYLVCIDPFTGVFTFVSRGFSGNDSDRFTVEHSGFLDNNIMVVIPLFWWQDVFSPI